MPSVMCLRLSDVSIVCRVTYLVSNSGLLFFHVGQTGGTAVCAQFTQYRTSDVAENLGRFLVWSIQARGMTELITTVETETRHPTALHMGNLLHHMLFSF